MNFADILVCQGIYQDRPGLPLTPGTETCGVIDAIGTDVDQTIGDRVVGLTDLKHGGYADQALLKAATILPVPNELDAGDATVLYSTFQTAHVGLFHRGQLQPGQWTLVLGAASGVGAAATQLAVARGARVIATAGGPDKLAHCRARGAEITVDSRSPSAADTLYETVMGATEGRGVDVAFDPVGGKLGEVIRRLIAWEGRLVVIGFASGDIPRYPANHILLKNYSVLGMAWSDYPIRQRPVIERAHRGNPAMAWRKTHPHRRRHRPPRRCRRRARSPRGPHRDRQDRHDSLKAPLAPRRRAIRLSRSRPHMPQVGLAAGRYPCQCSVCVSRALGCWTELVSRTAERIVPCNRRRVDRLNGPCTTDNPTNHTTVTTPVPRASIPRTGTHFTPDRVA